MVEKQNFLWGSLISEEKNQNWQMATSVSTRVLILGHSFVWHLATDLRWECVDRAVETFSVSGVDVQLYGVGGHTVQKLQNYGLYQVAKWS